MDKERKFAIKQAWLLDDDGNKTMEINLNSMDVSSHITVDESEVRGGYGSPHCFRDLSSWGKINICKDIKSHK